MNPDLRCPNGHPLGKYCGTQVCSLQHVTRSPNPTVASLLSMFDRVPSIALDCVLQYVLEPHREGFASKDPHVVVGAYVRRLVRDEPITEPEEDLAIRALNDLI